MLMHQAEKTTNFDCPKESFVNMGAYLRNAFKHLNTIMLWWSKVLQEPSISPMMPRDASLSDSYVSDRCCFSSQEI